MNRFSQSAQRLVHHFAGGTTVKIYDTSNPTRPPVEVPAVFPEMTFDERATLPGGTAKLQIARADLGDMPLDGRSLVELDGGGQYHFAPVSADGKDAPAAIPGDGAVLITGYIQAGAA